MSGIKTLKEAFQKKGLLAPSHRTLNVVDLAITVASISGSKNISPTNGSAQLARYVGTPNHLIFFLIDGLGMNLLERMSPNSFLNQYLAAELQTVFPSTTSTMLTTLFTCEWPSHHAVLGWDVYLPTIQDVATIIRFIRRSDKSNLSDIGVLPSVAYPVPSILDSFNRNTLFMTPTGIINTPFSQYLASDTMKIGFKSLREAVDHIQRHTGQTKGPTYTYIYWDEIDKVCHEYGTNHPAVSKSLRQLVTQLQILEKSLPKSTRIVLTGDHGLLNASEDQTHTIKSSDRLMDFLKAEPSGDKRLVQFHIQDGSEEIFKQLFNDQYGNQFALLTSQEAQDLQLFGPGGIVGESKRRLGNMMAISLGSAIMQYQGRTKKSFKTPSMSHHSGLSRSEMLVPLIIL
jgi:predicted AlkP superfamily pyrophosphatase or phosphodiesterase